MPGWIVFDERARLAGPLNGAVGTPNDYTWTQDNSTELEARWIRPVEDVDAPELERTLSEYGALPDEFGRAPETIVALEPPLYAIPCGPVWRRRRAARGATRRRGCAIRRLARPEPVRRRRERLDLGPPHGARRWARRRDRLRANRRRNCVQIKNWTHISQSVYSCASGVHTPRRRPLTALLNVDALSVTYGGVTAVNDVDLAVGEGRVVGLIGPNGAGKTSTIDALTGYHAPSNGTVTFGGDDITRMRPHTRARRGLTRTWQSVELFDDLTVEENLMVASERMGVLQALRDLLLPIGKHDRDDVDWALGLCGLDDVKDRLPTELSHGRRKLVGVARALAQRPRLVLMDEPAAGLDTEESAELGKHLRALPGEGVTVLLVDHDMSLVLSICDDVIVLDFGQVIARGTPDEIRRNDAVIAAYLGGQKEQAHG
jgi:branched-chain amino acid transport system ATP-binding protein